MKLAKRMNVITESPTTALVAKVAELKSQGKDVIGMNVGEPDFPTPENIGEAAKRAIDAGYTKYTPTTGIKPLREAIARSFHKNNGLSYDPDTEITVATGAKQALSVALLALLDKGDEVIIPTPCWVSYGAMVQLAEGEPVYVPVRDDNYELDVERIAAAITDKTRAIILCTPNNPTGAVYTEEQLRAVAKLAVEHDFFIIADEIYDQLMYDDAERFSIAGISDEVWQRTLTVNGVSKADAMTGWRIGWAGGPARLIGAMKALLSQTTSSTCSIAQHAAVEALNGPQDTVAVMREAFAERRDYLLSRLDRIPGIEFPKPRGAFYVLPDVSHYFGRSFNGKVIEDGVGFCDFLLEEALLAVAPGEAFEAPGKIRLSYASSMEAIEQAMDRLEEALDQLK